MLKSIWSKGGSGEEMDPSEARQGSTRSSHSIKSIRSSVSESSEPEKNQTSFAAQGSLAKLLGIRWVCTVDQNTFLRDKILNIGTLGYASKKAVSGAMALEGNQLGTRWRNRIMVVTTSTIFLFGTNKQLTAGLSPAAENLKHFDDTNDEMSKLMAKTGELKIAINFEDILYITKNDSVSSCIHISTSQVNGEIQNTVIRTPSESDCTALLSILEQGRKAFVSALKALKAGNFEVNRQKFSILQITKRDNEIGDMTDSPNEIVLRTMSIWRKTIHIGPLKRNESIQIYFSHPSQIGVFQVLLNCSNLDEISENKKKKWVPGEPLMLKGDDAVSSVATRNDPAHNTSKEKFSYDDNDSDDMESYDEISSRSIEPMSLRLLVAREDREMHVTVSEDDDDNTNNKGVMISVNAVVCQTLSMILLVLLAPAKMIGRTEVLTLLLVPVVTILVHVLFANRSKKTKKQKDGSKSETVIEKHYYVKLYEAQLGLVESLREDESTKVDTVGDGSEDGKPTKIGHLRGIEGVLAALDISRLDGEMNQDDVPYNWYIAVDGNRKEALERWIKSLEWRRSVDINNCLNVPQPHFFKIKNCWPQYFLGLEPEGNLVTLEKFRSLDKMCKGLRSKGVTPDDFAGHCVFLNEYWLQNRIAPYGKLIKILDVSGLAFGFNIRDVFKYFSRMNKDMQEYPEILNRCYIVNVDKAGSAFRFIWRQLPKFLEKRTFEKMIEVKDLHSPENPLLQIIDPDQLPKELGGKFEGELYDLPLEKDAADFARAINKKCGIKAEEDWAAEET